MDQHRVDTLALPAAERSPAAARAFLRDRLAEWGLQPLSEVGELVASELVTNAVRHGRPPLTLRVERSAAGVRVAVTDAAPNGRLLVDEPARLPEGGRGLLIVSALAARWGCERQPRAKQVWCDLEVG